jgi:hypothetical protein
MRDATAHEIESLRKAALKAEQEKREAPLSEVEVSRMIINHQINGLSVDDHTALRMVEFYPVWESGAAYAVGFKVTRNGKLWRVLQAHTSQIGWEPENAASLWEQIVRNYAGTEDDPIPYDGNMRLESGKYYIQSDVIYLCSRDTGNPVYHDLTDLVGLYVEVVT